MSDNVEKIYASVQKGGASGDACAGINFFDRLFSLAQHEATLAGLSECDGQDCAQAFVCRILDKPHRLQCSEAWLRRCALNYALNWRRSMQRRQRRETSWPPASDASASGGQHTFSAGRRTHPALKLS